MDLPLSTPASAPMATSLGTAVSPPEDTASELQRLRTELARSQQTLHAAQIKIQALTLELARHKRLLLAPTEN